MIINNPYIFGNYDIDALAFFTAASISDDTQKSAVNQLVLDLKAAGIWTKIKALYPFVGGTAAAHKWNLKDPRDLDAAFRLVFSGTWVHSATGALPDGGTASANTFFAPTQLASVNSTHLAFYNRSLTTSGQQFISDMGLYVGATQSSTLTAKNGSNSSFASSDDSVQASTSALSDYRGMFIGSRQSNTSLKLFRNGSSVAVNTTAAVHSLASVYYFIGAVNANANGPVISSTCSNRECALSSIGDGLSDGEAAAYSTAVQAFQTTLGRQV